MGGRGRSSGGGGAHGSGNFTHAEFRSAVAPIASRVMAWGGDNGDEAELADALQKASVGETTEVRSGYYDQDNYKTTYYNTTYTKKSDGNWDAHLQVYDERFGTITTILEGTTAMSSDKAAKDMMLGGTNIRSWH